MKRPRCGDARRQTRCGNGCASTVLVIPEPKLTLLSDSVRWRQLRHRNVSKPIRSALDVSFAARLNVGKFVGWIPLTRRGSVGSGVVCPSRRGPAPPCASNRVKEPEQGTRLRPGYLVKHLCLPRTLLRRNLFPPALSTSLTRLYSAGLATTGRFAQGFHLHRVL